MKTIQAANVNLEILREHLRTTLYTHHGDYVFESGPEGTTWSLKVTNVSSRRIEVVLVVDGKDTITGETRRYLPLTQNGLVIPAGQSWEFRGFRRGNEHLARFRFSDLEGTTSYASQTGGSVEDNGVIRVGIYTEEVFIAPNITIRPLSNTHSKSLNACGPMKAHASMPVAGTAAHVGTTFGETESSHVGTTTFRRSTVTPVQKFNIHYYPSETLRTLGIIPSSQETLGGCPPPANYY